MIDALQGMSSDELFNLAEKRREEEAAQKREAMKEQISEIRARLRALDRDYKKNRAALEAEVNALTGKQSKTVSSGGRTQGVSAKIVEIVQGAVEITTKEIGAQLDALGMKPKNLSQSMAYLKKRGEVVSVGHGIYRKP